MLGTALSFLQLGDRHQSVELRQHPSHLVEARAQEQDHQGVLLTGRVGGVCAVAKFVRQALHQVRCGQKTLIARALTDAALKRRHHKTLGDLAKLAAQGSATGGNHAFDGLTNHAQIRGDLVRQAGQTCARARQLDGGHVLDLAHLVHPLRGLSGPLHGHGRPTHCAGSAASFEPESVS